jgi:hypothetical protein
MARFQTKNPFFSDSKNALAYYNFPIPAQLTAWRVLVMKNIFLRLKKGSSLLQLSNPSTINSMTRFCNEKYFPPTQKRSGLLRRRR